MFFSFLELRTFQHYLLTFYNFVYCFSLRSWLFREINSWSRVSNFVYPTYPHNIQTFFSLPPFFMHIYLEWYFRSHFGWTIKKKKDNNQYICVKMFKHNSGTRRQNLSTQWGSNWLHSGLPILAQHGSMGSALNM